MTGQKIYPFKFLNAYTREDKDIFFGREEEIDALYEMVFQTDLLLVYGASGTGKTSLIQCGLASRFQLHDWLALNIRRGNNLNESLDKALAEAGDSDVNERDDNLDWLDEPGDSVATDVTSTSTTETSTLARRLKSIYLKYFKPVYLIFDQFEELYILGEKDEQNQFIETVREILRVEQPVKIIFSIREEYLGYLYEFERKVPELLRKKLRVEPMNLDKVRTVVKNIGQLPQSLVHLKSGEEDEIAQGIFEKIKEKKNTRTVELPYLQVFMDKFYLQICGDETHKTEATFSLAELKKMGNIGNVLRDFLDEQVLKIAKKFNQRPEKVWDALKPFVTRDGTKEPLRQEELCSQFEPKEHQFITACLQAFVNSRILRFNKNEERYEIAHDSLAKQIHAQRSDEEIALLEVQSLIKSQVALKIEAREFFSEKQLQFIEPYGERLQLNIKEKDWLKKSQENLEKIQVIEKANKAKELSATKKRLRIFRGLFIILTLALSLAGYFWKKANQQKVYAEEQRIKAENSLAEFRRIKFKELENRSFKISNGGICPPEEILSEMKNIVENHPDSLSLQQRFQKILDMNNCSLD